MGPQAPPPEILSQGWGGHRFCVANLFPGAAAGPRATLRSAELKPRGQQVQATGTSPGRIIPASSHEALLWIKHHVLATQGVVREPHH